MLKKLEEAEKALNDLSWETVRLVRNANGGLYPLNWENVKRRWKGSPGSLEFANEKEFEKSKNCSSNSRMDF